MLIVVFAGRWRLWVAACFSFSFDSECGKCALRVCQWPIVLPASCCMHNSHVTDLPFVTSWGTHVLCSCKPQAVWHLVTTCASYVVLYRGNVARDDIISLAGVTTIRDTPHMLVAELLNTHGDSTRLMHMVGLFLCSRPVLLDPQEQRNKPYGSACKQTSQHNLGVVDGQFRTWCAGMLMSCLTPKCCPAMQIL